MLECNRVRRFSLMLALRGFDLKIFGASEWMGLVKGTTIEKAYQGKGLLHHECYDFYRSATISLSIHPLFLHSSPNIREYDIPMCGGFVLSDVGMHAGPEIRSYFEPDQEIALFETGEQLMEKVQYYLDRPEERKRITRAAQERIRREHTYKHRMQTMLDAFQRYRSSDNT
jgi:spore maturation protein CgeB